VINLPVKNARVDDDGGTLLVAQRAGRYRVSIVAATDAAGAAAARQA
jgi:hypothetical protein